MNSMFNNATAFNCGQSSGVAHDLMQRTATTGWQVGTVTNMDGMFQDAAAFNGNISAWCETPITTTPADFATGANASFVVGRQPTWGACPYPNGLVLVLDAGNPASYPGTGTIWTDTVGGKTFTLYNNPTYSSDNGGYLNFNTTATQYGYCTNSLPNLSQWTVIAWHYWDGTWTGTAPAIVTDAYPGQTYNLNYCIAPALDDAPYIEAGFYNGNSWETTPSNAYQLTPNTWHQVVGTYDGSSIKLYVDNVLVEQASQTGTPISSQGGIYLMRRWDIPEIEECWGGNLGVVQIYNYSLSTSDITNNWNANRSRFGL
jgi:hypothetical protein